MEAEKGEEEGRVSAGPVGAGATKGSHSWPCPEEPPFWQEKTGKGLWESGKDRLVLKPHSPGGCRREGQAAGSPLHIARAAQNCCGSLGDRETVSKPLSTLPWDAPPISGGDAPPIPGGDAPPSQEGMPPYPRRGCPPYPGGDAPLSQEGMPPYPGGDTHPTQDGMPPYPRRGYLPYPWRGCPPIPGGDTHPTQEGIPPYPWRGCPPIPGGDAHPVPGGDATPSQEGTPASTQEGMPTLSQEGMPPPCHTGSPPVATRSVLSRAATDDTQKGCSKPGSPRSPWASRCRASGRFLERPHRATELWTGSRVRGQGQGRGHMAGRDQVHTSHSRQTGRPACSASMSPPTESGCSSSGSGFSLQQAGAGAGGSSYPSSAPDTMCSSLMSWTLSMEPLRKEP